MRYDKAISYRYFLGGTRMSTLGLQAYKQNTRQDAPGSATTVGNRPDKVATQPTKTGAPTVAKPVVQKYSFE